MRRVGHFVEAIIFNSRWLIAPFLLGLVVGLAALVLKFLIKLYEFVVQIPQAPPADVIVGILTLVDLTLVASLIVLVILLDLRQFHHRHRPRETSRMAGGTGQNRLLGTQAETVRRDRGHCRGQRTGMVHGHRAAGRQHQAGLGRRHPARLCGLNAHSCGRGLAERA